jgi:hypothetical protein
MTACTGRWRPSRTPTHRVQVVGQVIVGERLDDHPRPSPGPLFPGGTMTISADQAVATSQIDHDIQPEVISW